MGLAIVGVVVGSGVVGSVVVGSVAVVDVVFEGGEYFLKVSGQYLYFLWSYTGFRNKLLT